MKFKGGAMRLNKYISNSGLTSRRGADQLIFSKKVKVNGQIIIEPGYMVRKGDEVEIGGRIIRIESKVYYMLNKPIGYMSSLKDPHYHKFVVDLIDTDYRVYPVGRLDIDSRGLIILTNDGELTNKLTHPSYQVKKKYLVETNSPLTLSDIKKIEEGVIIDSKHLVRGKINTLGSNKYEITISEGKNRQIRKMIGAIDKEVIDLTRIQMGSLKLGNLSQGHYRPLTTEEVKELKEI